MRDSAGMRGILNYQDNDPTSGLVDPKSTTRGPIFKTKDVRKENWKPRNKVDWVQPAKQPLTL